MRSWQALSVLVVLIGWPPGVEAETSTDRRPLVIPETAPVPPPNSPPRIIYCGSGLISAEEYEEWWRYWRAIALSAEGPAQRECRAFALIELAELPSRRAFGHFGAPYWRAAVETLQEALPEDDPRLAGVRLRYAESGGLPARDRERLFRSSLRALEAAAARPGEVPDLGCSFLRETGVWFSKLSGELRAATPTDRRKLLSRAQLALLRLLVEAGRTQEALAVAHAARQHLARRLELDGGAHDTYRFLATDASSLVGFLERLPSAQVPEQQLTEAVDLLRRAAPERSFQRTQGLRSLAKYHAERKELARAEEALRRSLEQDYETARAERKDPGRISPPDHLPRGALFDLAEIYNLQRRWPDLEKLYLDDLAEAVTVDAESAGDSLRSLIHFYRRHERYDEALNHLRHLDRILPDRWSTHVHYAGIYSDLGRLSEAEAELREAFRLLSRTADRDGAGRTSLLESLARVQRRTGQTAAAEASLTEAVEIYETTLARRKPGISLWVVRCSRARLLVELGRFDEAETLYREAEAELASKPASHRLDLTMPLLGRMRIAAARGDAKRAAALLEESVKVCSDGREAGTAGLERCLTTAAERAAEAGLDGPAAELRRRADETTAWARAEGSGTDEAPLPIASRSPR